MVGPSISPIAAVASLPWRGLTESEYDGFCGASDDAKIAEFGDFVLIFDNDRVTAYEEERWFLGESLHEWEAM